jgi:DNA-binding transcriptional LysR family regulator
MNQLLALKYFCKVVESGSFTSAANAFSVPPSSISRRISDLETSLGTNLLKRSTRVVKPTEIGQIYFEQVTEILLQLDQSTESVKSYQTTPMGQLRISSMVSFGEQLLCPLLDEFTARYPDIVLDVSLSDELSSLANDDVDVAIRGGYAPDEHVHAIRLMPNEFIPVASPAYLAIAGTPSNGFELREHPGLFFRTPRGPSPWLLKTGDQWHDVSGKPIVVSNNAKWLIELGLRGKGIMMAPRWSANPYLQTGELVALLDESDLSVSQNQELAIYLLYQKPRYLVPKVKAFVDFLTERLMSPDGNGI